MKVSEVIKTAAEVYQHNGGYRGDDFFDREQADAGTPAMECPLSLPGAVNVAAGIDPAGVDWDFLAQGGSDSEFDRLERAEMRAWDAKAAIARHLGHRVAHDISHAGVNGVLFAWYLAPGRTDQDVFDLLRQVEEIVRQEESR